MLSESRRRAMFRHPVWPSARFDRPFLLVVVVVLVLSIAFGQWLVALANAAIACTVLYRGQQRKRVAARRRRASPYYGR